jgi:hypothetical protein
MDSLVKNEEVKEAWIDFMKGSLEEVDEVDISKIRETLIESFGDAMVDVVEGKEPDFQFPDGTEDRMYYRCWLGLHGHPEYIDRNPLSNLDMSGWFSIKMEFMKTSHIYDLHFWISLGYDVYNHTQWSSWAEKNLPWGGDKLYLSKREICLREENTNG